jgi:hypothetical protein
MEQPNELPTTAGPTTKLTRATIRAAIAAFNKVNANYPPEIRTASLKNLLNEMSQEDLGNYGVLGALVHGLGSLGSATFVAAKNTRNAIANLKETDKNANKMVDRWFTTFKAPNLNGGIRKTRRGRIARTRTRRRR